MFANNLNYYYTHKQSSSMAKLTAVVVLFLAALAAAASSSAYTTAVRAETCESEIDEHLPMTNCVKWVESTAVPWRMEGSEEELKEKCCSELGQLSSHCRCAAAWEMMIEMPDIWMRRMACSLPSLCDMGSCACPRLRSAAGA